MRKLKSAVTNYLSAILIDMDARDFDFLQSIEKLILLGRPKVEERNYMEGSPSKKIDQIVQVARSILNFGLIAYRLR